jgi:hypothetical protein
VLERVRQCFLHDAVGGEIDTERYRPTRPLDTHLDRQSRLTHLWDQRLELAQPRLRHEPELLAVGAQESRHPGHLDERLAAGLLHRPQRLERPSGRAPQEETDEGDLQAHDRV